MPLSQKNHIDTYKLNEKNLPLYEGGIPSPLKFLENSLISCKNRHTESLRHTLTQRQNPCAQK